MPPQDRSFLARFGRVILSDGIATVPRSLFTYQGRLGLSPQATWFVASILSHKWDSDLPHPSLRNLAEQTGVSRAQLHRFERELVDRGLLTVVNRTTTAGGKASNLYDFSPLLQLLEQYITEDHKREAEEKAAFNKLIQGYVSPADIGDVSPAGHDGLTGGPHEEALEETDPEEDLSKFERSDPRSVARDDPDRETLSAYVEDVAAELGDRAKLSASVTRAVRIYRKSGQDLESFVGLLFKARSLTREHQASIRTGERQPGQPRSVMHYWFAVLEDLARTNTT